MDDESELLEELMDSSLEESLEQEEQE